MANPVMEPIAMKDVFLLNSLGNYASIIYFL